MEQEIDEQGTKELKSFKTFGIIVLIVVLVFFSGFIRIYYGGNVGLRIQPKYYFSLKHTIINLDDLYNMPRITVMYQYPEVKYQLENMGLIETDDEWSVRLQAEAIAKITGE